MDSKRSVTKTRILTGLLVLAIIAALAAIPFTKTAMKAYAEWRYRCDHCKVCDKPATHIIMESHADIADLWKSSQYGLCDDHAKAYFVASKPASTKAVTKSPANP